MPYLKKSTTTRPIITHNVKERKGLVFLAGFFRMCLNLKKTQNTNSPAAVGVFLRLRKKVVPLHHKTQKSRL